jgi:phospholipid transport system substrate-binding protein
MRGAPVLLLAGLLGLGSGAASAANDAAPVGAAAPAAAPDPAASRAPVERLYAALEDAMARADALGFDGRYGALEPVVASSYDMPFMAQLILGSAWRGLAPEQQARWIGSFTRFTVSTYADRFDGLNVRFEVGATEPAAQGTSLVHTTLHRKDDEPVKLDYRVRAAADGWRIVDVYLNGTVSELALRRSEYSALMKREGFDALLAALEAKSAAAKAGTADEAGAP